MTARQLAADDTRRRLYAAAIALFGQAGYHGTTVDAIAKRAGVAKGTFFVHFPTKDAVVIDLVRRQVAVARAARVAALPEGPLAALRATVLALGSEAGRARELSRAVLAATLENPAVAQDADELLGLVLADLMLDARAARPDDAAALAHNLMAAFLGAAFHFTSSRGSPEMAAILNPLVDALLRPPLALETRHAPVPLAARRRNARRG